MEWHIKPEQKAHRCLYSRFQTYIASRKGKSVLFMANQTRKN